MKHPDTTYEPLSPEDRNTLADIRNKKLKSFAKVAAVSLLLPYACAVAVILFLNLPILYGKLSDPSYREALIYPRSLVQLIEWTYYFTIGFSHVFIIVIVANTLYFFFKILKYCIDPLKGIKKVIPFYPEKYRPPGFTDHFIKTGLPKPDFIPIDDDVYFAIIEENEYYLELAPYSNYLLAVKDNAGNYLKLN